MIEAGVVISTSGHPLFWHSPPGRTCGNLPDSRTLWEVFWDAHKEGTLLGFAHTHPGNGVPGPSYEDVTTFSAVELALGKRITWWISSSDHTVMLTWAGPDKYRYKGTLLVEEPAWVAELRRLSAEEQGR